MTRRIYPRPGLSLTFLIPVLLLAIFGTLIVTRAFAKGQEAAPLVLVSVVGIYLISWMAWWGSHIAISARGVSLVGFRRKWLDWSDIVGFEVGDRDSLMSTVVLARTVLGNAEKVGVVPYQPIFLDTRERHRRALERVLASLERERLARSES